MNLTINNNQYRQNFGIKLSEEICPRLYHEALDITCPRLVKRLQGLRYWGSNNSIISYKLDGLNKDRFVLTSPTVSSKEIPITNKTEQRGFLNTFFEEINEEKILEAEKALYQ